MCQRISLTVSCSLNATLFWIFAPNTKHQTTPGLCFVRRKAKAKMAAMAAANEKGGSGYTMVLHCTRSIGFDLV